MVQLCLAQGVVLDLCISIMNNELEFGEHRRRPIVIDEVILDHDGLPQQADIAYSADVNWNKQIITA